MVRRELARVELMPGEQPQERRRRERVDETGRDRDVLDPQRPRGAASPARRARRCWRCARRRAARLTVSSNAAGVPTASIETSAPRPSVRPRTIGERSSRVGLTTTSAPNCLAASSRLVGQVDRDDVARAVQPRADDRGEADRTGADDGDDVAGRDLPVEHADLVAGRQDVGDHQDLLVGHAGRAPDTSRCRRTARARTRPGCRR